MKKYLPLTIAALAFAAILLLVFSFDFGSLAQSAPQLDPGKTKGNPNAPVTFLELSDFQ